MKRLDKNVDVMFADHFNLVLHFLFFGNLEFSNFGNTIHTNSGAKDFDFVTTMKKSVDYWKSFRLIALLAPFDESPF